MTQREKPAEYPNRSIWTDDGGQQADEPEIGQSSPERTRAANEVGSAIVHQLNGPLTALRLYVGEIRRNNLRSHQTEDAQDNMQEMVEGAFQETERVCAMMGMIADGFEGPLYPETAAALGRDVINWWSRSGGTEAHGHSNGGTAARAASFALLTPREREVLDHVSQGCSNKQGALRLHIGPRTFESHRARIMRKLGARNGADLVRIALGENSLSL
jgi:DNA-binding CsgD family transcriptional regulator